MRPSTSGYWTTTQLVPSSIAAASASKSLAADRLGKVWLTSSSVKRASVWITDA
jgi:hypothetical protein